MIQLVSIPPSVIIVLVGQAKSWFVNEPEESIIEDIKRKLFVLPFLMAWDVALVGAGITICIVSFKLFLINMVSFMVFMRVLGIISTRFMKLKTMSQRSWFTVLKLVAVAIWVFCFMTWTIATYENPENDYIIHNIAKIAIFADIIFVFILFIVVFKIKKELTSDAFWAPTKI